MEKIIHRFSLDVNKNGVQRTIQGIETGERYARELRITLRNGKENYEIPSDDSVKAVMYIRKPSSEIVSVNDCTIEGDEIVYLLGAEDVSVAGTIIMQLKVIGSLRGGAEAVLVSPRFNLEVWESETDDSGAESTDTFTALENALAQAQIAYSGRVTHVEIDEDYLITVTFNNGQTYESDALQQMSDKIKEIDESVEALDTKVDESVEALDTKVDESVEALDTKIDGKADKVDPTTSGTFTHNGDAKMEDIDAHIIKATSLKYMESDGYHIVANEIKTLNDKDASLRNELTYVEGSVSKTTQELKEEIESASERAEDAYNLASRANREAANAINKANDNKVKIDLHTGLIGEGVGDKVPILGYLDGYYIAPNGSVTQYNATATLIKIDFLDFLFRGDNIIFNHVDLLPTENCLACAWYDISGNFISATDGLNIIAEIDEQTFKITKQYIDYCVIPVPAGAHSCKLSGLANGRADIRIQTSLSEAIKDLQSKPEPATLVLTNPSPLPCTDGKKILGIHAKGNSTQNGTPTPTSPIPIIDASTEVVAKSEDGTQSNTITLPYTLKSVGNVADELIVNEDGSGKIVQRVFEYRLPSSNAWALLETKTNTLRFVIANVLSAVNTECMCEYFKPTTQVGMGKIDEPSICVRDDLKGIAVMIDKATASTKEQFLAWLNSNEVILRYCATPIETPLTAEEVASIRALQTYKGTTVIDSEMQIESVTYSGDVKAYIDGFHTYSTKPTICGYEEDGTPRYRVKIYTTTPNTSGSVKVISNQIKSTTHNIKRMEGFLQENTNIIPITFFFGTTLYGTTWVNPNGINMIVSSNDYINRTCEIEVEYTLNEESGIALLSNEGEVVANE